MEKVKFVLVKSFLFDSLENSSNPNMRYYQCEGGDQTGEYVRAEVAEELLVAAKKAVIAMKNSNCDSQAQDNLHAAIANAEK